MVEDYVIYIGGKPFMNYVTAVVMQFTMHNAEKVVLRTRGKFMNRAIDVAEIVRHRFLKDQIAVGEIKIDSEEFTNKEGRNVRVSTLDVTLTRVGDGIKLTSKKLQEPAPESAPSEEKAA